VEVPSGADGVGDSSSPPEVTVNCLVRYQYQADAAKKAGAHPILSGKADYSAWPKLPAGGL
jgi:hypothetical protein